MEQALRGRGSDERLEKRRGMRDDGDRAAVLVRLRCSALVGCGQQIGGRHVLRGQNPIQGVERELAAAVQEIGQIRLAKAGLASVQRNAERPPLYSAQQFQAEVLVHLREIHLWKICRRQWDEFSSHFLSKSY